ncbi:MAG: transcription antitermination factor NusB [Bacteroidota bacterium]|nr:transcription antitermination factor NusB [Bacteroidota bacterium]
MNTSDGAEQENPAPLVRELEKNISRLYEAYLYLLKFLEELSDFANQYDDEQRSRYIPIERDLKANLRFFHNPILQKLVQNKHFHTACEKYKVVWNSEGENSMLRKIYFDFKNQEVYKEYAQFADENSLLNQDILVFALKHYSTNMALFSQHLEEEYTNWPDDKKIVLQMAIKTVQSIGSDLENEDILQPLSNDDDEILDFAKNLLKKTLSNQVALDLLIHPKTQKWEDNHIAKIDKIILRMAICEFLHFPSIPAKVSINEYIELSKNYSTPQSKKFINGVLDSILKDLKANGTIVKN